MSHVSKERCQRSQQQQQRTSYGNQTCKLFQACLTHYSLALLCSTRKIHQWTHVLGGGVACPEQSGVVTNFLLKVRAHISSAQSSKYARLNFKTSFLLMWVDDGTRNISTFAHQYFLCCGSECRGATSKLPLILPCGSSHQFDVKSPRRYFAVATETYSFRKAHFSAQKRLNKRAYCYQHLHAQLTLDDKLYSDLK